MTSTLTFTQNCLVSIFVFGFVFVSVYVPQPLNKVPQAVASLPVIDATAIAIAGINAGYNAASAAALGSLTYKETVVDGIFYALARAIIVVITNSILEWINSGFEGSPAFVQDLKANYLAVADNEFMLFMEEAGKPLSFLCGPFALDIQLALTVSYNQRRDRLPAACTLTGALANFEDFIAGDFSAGGWDAWFKVINQPETYTSYGNYLEAEASMYSRIVLGQKELETQLSWGKGFLSKKVCDPVVGDGPEQNCKIVTPGDTIAETLNFQLSVGGRGLIEADEMNEIIGALIAQLAQTALTGIGGLLGLSADGSGPGGGSYLDELRDSDGFTFDSLNNSVNASLATEERYRNEALLYARLLAEFAASTTYSQARRNQALFESNNIIQNLIPAIDANIAELTAILDLIDTAPPNPDPNLIQTITQRYSALRPRLHTEAGIDGSVIQWRTMLDPSLGS